MDAFIGGICGSKLTVIKATYRMQIFDLSAVTQFILLFRKEYWKSKIMVMNNKGTNAYTIRNFRRVKKNAYTRIACVHLRLRCSLISERHCNIQNTSYTKKSCYQERCYSLWIVVIVREIVCVKRGPPVRMFWLLK